jgi:NAD(P)-dependent dehydrogenase (short-subunit alcohol dehydrogenase family)
MRFFDIPVEAFQFVSNLNLLGTVLPSQVFGKLMAAQKEGVILNVSSMNAFRPQDLVGATLWLLSPASAFVSGVVVPIDGGFSAYSGV